LPSLDGPSETLSAIYAISHRAFHDGDDGSEFELCQRAWGNDSGDGARSPVATRTIPALAAYQNSSPAAGGETSGGDNACSFKPGMETVTVSSGRELAGLFGTSEDSVAGINPHPAAVWVARRSYPQAEAESLASGLRLRMRRSTEFPGGIAGRIAQTNGREGAGGTKKCPLESRDSSRGTNWNPRSCQNVPLGKSSGREGLSIDRRNFPSRSSNVPRHNFSATPGFFETYGGAMADIKTRP